MSVLARSVLFISSYAPLLALFWLLGSFGPYSVWAGWAAGGSTGCLILIWLVTTRCSATDKVRFTEPRSRDADVMAYVVTYVVPFAAAASKIDVPSRWALILFATLIGVLYVRSAVFYVHPLLLVVGIHVYDVSRDGMPAALLTRRRLVPQSQLLNVVDIGANVYIDRGDNQ